MAQEVELKLRLPKRAAKLLLSQPSLQGLQGRRQRLHNTYFDTPDLVLRTAHIELRQRQAGEALLQTVKLGSANAGGLTSRGEWEDPMEAGHFDFSRIDDKPLRQRLEKSKASLQPIFTTRVNRTSWQLRGRSGSDIELVLDRGVIESQGKQTPICEVELELKEGNAADLFNLAKQLRETLPLHPEETGKAERGYALWLGQASPPTKAKPPALTKKLQPLCAFRAIALSCLGHLQGNQNGARMSNGEPEYIHQMRVAVRRLRSALKLFDRILPAGFVEQWDPRWRDLGTQLGQARNWDIFVTQTLPPLTALFPDAAELRLLVRVGERQRSACRKVVRAAIDGDAHSRLLLDFAAALYVPPFAAADGEVHGEGELSEFAVRRLTRLAKRAKALARRIDELDTAERHRMRIAFKKLRYAVEFLASLFPRRRLKPYIKELERLQDALGELNDVAVAQRLIADVPGVSANGLTAGWLAAHNDLLVRTLPEKLKCFLDVKSPWN